MPSLNHVMMMGHLCADPELRYSSGGKEVCSFRIGVNSGYGDHKETLFIRCCCFGKVAESVAKHSSKGQCVLAIGRLRENKWTDKNGVDRVSQEIVCDSVKFIGGPREREDVPAATGTDGAAF